MEVNKVNNINTKKVIKNFLNIGIGIIGIVYLIVLIKIILFKYGLTSEARSLNLVPFEFLNVFIDRTELDIALKNVLGNIAIFIPLGIFISYMIKKKILISGVICLLISLLFEAIQFVTGCGATDIDDLILNTIGGVIGVLIYEYLLKHLDEKVDIPIVTVSFLVLFGVCGKLSLYLYAPNMLPAEIVFENEEVFNNVDKDSYDFSATYIEVSDGVIYLDEESISINESTSKEKIEKQYTLSNDATIIKRYMSYKYSPNGNIQKTIVSYSLVDEKSAMEILKEEERGFMDLWIDDEDKCKMFVFTIYEDNLE